MLDHCQYPRPEDVFGANSKRDGVYGLHEDTEHEDLHDTQPPGISSAPPKVIVAQCTRAVHALFSTRNLAATEKCYIALPPCDRHQLIHTLISEAMTSGDDSDAVLVASFLSLPALRRGSGSDGQSATELVKAFVTHIVMLEDTALDVPSAYRSMAMMLHASGLPFSAIEDLAARIIVPENPARDRLLEEVSALGPVSAEEPEEGGYGTTELDPSGEEEGSASEYAYAY